MIAAPPPVVAVAPAPAILGVAIHARSLGPGRVRLSTRVLHSPQGGPAGTSASWYVAARGSRRFHLAAVTSTRELSPGLTYASAIVDPPAKRFTYRVCLSSSRKGKPRAHAAVPASCPAHDFTAHRKPSKLEREYQGEGRGIPMTDYPSAPSISAAVSYLDGRSGRTSCAVVNSDGQLSGVRIHEHFETASVVKVMMLIAYLQMLSAHHRGLEDADNELLYPMIHISDNDAASAVFAIVGNGALARVARESSMSDYAPGVGWWAYTQTSAADQARLMYALPHLIPPQFYPYARGLLDGIEPSQSWGAPPVARPAWQVFFKTGALPEEGLFNEVARLERPGVTFALAVLTEADPSMGYGEQTIEGVAARLIARSPERASA